jgi:hypothetical protein
VSSGGMEVPQMLAQSYNVLTNFHHFVAVLRSDAKRRGWLES